MGLYVILTGVPAELLRGGSRNVSVLLLIFLATKLTIGLLLNIIVNM
jgi:hypothetical protein